MRKFLMALATVYSICLSAQCPETLEEYMGEEIYLPLLIKELNVEQDLVEDFASNGGRW